MAINIFKKKEASKSAPAKTIKAEHKAERAGKPVEVKPRQTVSVVAYRELVRPHITEKATVLAEDNRYVFRVYKTATKGQIAQAVRDVYGTKVQSVRVITIPEKKVRMGRRRQGVKPGFKKAIVQLAKGEKIEIMPR